MTTAVQKFYPGDIVRVVREPTPYLHFPGHVGLAMIREANLGQSHYSYAITYIRTDSSSAWYDDDELVLVMPGHYVSFANKD